MLSSIKQAPYWVYIVLFFCFFALLGEIINDRFQLVDFEVYYRTAERLIAGKNLYRVDGDGHYVYKYSPVAALFFIPLAVLPFSIAKVLFWIGLSTIMVALIQLLLKAIPSPYISNKQKALFGFIGFLSILPHLHKELHLGQVNMVLLFMYVLSMYAYSNKNWWAFGLLISTSIFIKPFGFIFLGILVLNKQWKALLTLIGCLVICFTLPFIFYPDYQNFSQLYIDWIQELSIEMNTKQALSEDRNHTIFSVLYRYSPLQLLSLNETGQKIYQIILLGLMGSTYLWAFTKGRLQDKLALFSPIIAFIPLIAFTSENAFLFTLPLTIYLLPKYPTFNRIQRVLFIFALLLIGGNIHDLVGRTLHEYIQDLSVYSFGALILLGLFFRGRKTPTTV